MTIILEMQVVVNLRNFNEAATANGKNITRDEVATAIHDMWQHEEQVMRARFGNRLTQYLKFTFGENQEGEIL